LDQMTLIFEVLGSPTEDDMRCITNLHARRYVSYMPKAEKRPWNEMFPRCDPLAYDLLERLLKFNPKNRITVNEALAHPYLSLYADPDDEPVCRHPFTAEMELDDLPTPRLKELIFQEVVEYKRKLPQTELLRTIVAPTKHEENRDADSVDGKQTVNKHKVVVIEGKQQRDSVASKAEE